MVEHHTCNMVVGGSIPLLSLNLYKTSMNILLYAYLFFLFLLFVPVFIQLYTMNKIIKVLERKTAKLIE